MNTKETNAPSPETFPMRINKYLAHQGVATRRAVDELIKKRLVFINGKQAELGAQVTQHDRVEVKQKGKQKKYAYYAYHKPEGIVTHSADPGDKEIADIIDLMDKKGVFPIGRLDKRSHGLIILTNDGRITERLLNPARAHEKEYVVKTKDKLRGSFKEKIERGVQIEQEMTKPCTVKILGEKSFAITLTEGKHHQIRRMVAALFNEVLELKRTRIMNIKLGKLKSGEYREIQDEELKTLLVSLGLS